MNDRTLWAFGCSHTYGHGLKDCITEKNGAPPIPSQLGYASILAKKLNLPLKNLSRPGVGNKHIFFRLQQEISKNTIRSNDIILVQWSYIERNCIIQSIDTPDERHFFSTDKEDSVKMLAPWVKDKTSKLFYKSLYNEVDAVWHTVNYINLAHAILKGNGINDTLHIAPPYGGKNMDGGNPAVRGRGLWDIFVKKNYFLDDIPMCKQEITAMVVDKALDNAHPGPKTQQIYADYLFDNFYN